MNNTQPSMESLLKRLKADPSGPDAGGRFKCPLCGNRTLFQVTNTPYAVCKSCNITMDPIQMASKCMNVSEAEAEHVFQYGDLKGTFDPSTYNDQFGASRKGFFSMQAEMLAFVGDGAARLKNAKGILDIYLNGVVAGASYEHVPPGIGSLPSALERPVSIKNMKLPESAVILPYMLHGVITHIDFVETVSGRTHTKALIPTEHGLFPDISGVESPTVYVAMSPKAALALQIKHLKKANTISAICHQKIQKVPLPWIKETVLVDCLEAPLDMKTACQYFELSGPSNPIKVVSIRQSLASVPFIDLDKVLAKGVGILSWMAMQLNELYTDGGQATVFSLAHSIPMSDDKKKELINKIKSLPKFSLNLVDMLTAAVNSGPSTVVNGRTIAVRGTSTDIVFPDRFNLADAGIYVKSGVHGKNFFGFDLTVLMANVEPLNVLVRLEDICNETTLANKILTAFMSKMGINKVPVFTKHPLISWRVLIPKLAEGLPVLPLIAKLGHLDNHIYFPNCGFNLATGQMSPTDRGLAHDLPDHVTGYYAQLHEPKQDMSELARAVFSSKNSHDIGFTMMVCHTLYGVVQSAIRTNFHPAHLVVTDREKEFWAPVTRILHDGIHYDRRIPSLSYSTGEMDKFIKHYEKLGTLPMPCRAVDSCDANISHLLENVNMPLLIFSSDTVAAKLSGIRSLSYMSRPSYIEPAEKSIILSGAPVTELVSWLMKLALDSRHELTLCYTSTPAATMRNHICTKLGIPVGDYANKFNTQTYSLFKYNSVLDMFAALHKIFEEPGPLTVKALLAYAGPLENLPENYIGLVKKDCVHLHKDRTIRILNSENPIFNKRTIEEQLKLEKMLKIGGDAVNYPECWSIVRQVWDLQVSPVCPQDTELQIREMLAAILQEDSTPEELWTIHSRYDLKGIPIEHTPHHVAMN